VLHAILAFLCSAAHNRYGNITGRAAPPGQPWVKAFNIFNALGSIAFAYNFTGVLMEIQVGHMHHRAGGSTALRVRQYRW
jgi:hypothetical protein